MPERSANRIPGFYRIFFTWIDPILCIWGAYMDFFDPNLVLSGHITNAVPNIGHEMILRMRGGWMLHFGLLSTFLLRYTNDQYVWKLQEIGGLIIDITYFWAAWGALNAQNRLSPSTWRAEDWGSIAITGTATLVRLVFSLGIGLSSGRSSLKKT